MLSRQKSRRCLDTRRPAEDCPVNAGSATGNGGTRYHLETGGVVDVRDGETDVDRLRSDLAEAQKQLAATSEVLTAIGRSTSDVDAILGAVVDSARRLCRADVAQIHLVEGDLLRLARSSGLSEAGVEFMARNPVGPDRRSLIGRVAALRPYATDHRRALGSRLRAVRSAAARRPAHRPGRPDAARRRTRSASCWCGGSQVGSVRRPGDRGPDHLRRPGGDRHPPGPPGACPGGTASTSCGQKVEQLEALGEIGQAVSSSLDLDEVLDRIVTHAVQLSGTDGGSMLEFDDDRFQVRAAYGTSARTAGAAARRSGSTSTARWSAERRSAGRPLQVPDLRDEPTDPHLRRLQRGRLAIARRGADAA